MKHLIFTILVSVFTLSANAQSLDSSFAQTNSGGGLTDQQANEAQTFVHQGVKDAALKKACEEAGKACDPNGPDNTKVILPSMIEQNIGKLYTLLFGGMSIMSGGPKVSIDPNKGKKTETPKAENPKEAGADKAADKKGKDEASDYCMYAAIAYEGVATALQVGQQQKTSQEAANLNDPQLSALVQLKETHKARKRTATYQSAVYGATAACYVARKLLQPSVVMDTKYIIKMTAAAGISALYMKKASKHADAMKKIQKVIDSMPKAGDCNPWTGTSCFCKEPTSKTLYPGQYQEVCVLNNGVADGPKANLGCGVMSNGKVQFDANCNCKTNNTCISASLKFANPSIGLGSNFLNATNDGYALLDSSQFDEGRLKDFSNGAAALNSRIKNKPMVPDVNMTEEQKRIADSLKDVVPPAVANLASTVPTSPVGADAALGTGVASSGLSKLSEPLKKQISDPEVSGKYRSMGGSSDVGGGEEVAFNMPQAGAESAAGGSEVLTFADKALSNAEVSNRPETPIFDIISNRYRSSGWTRLNPE